MNAAYLENRLQASIRMMNAASEPCSRRAHEGLVKAYRALIVRGRLRIVVEDVFTPGPVSLPAQQATTPPSPVGNDVAALRPKHASGK